jgi:hypothetical protein
MKRTLPILLACALLGACASNAGGGGSSPPGQVNMPAPGGVGSSPETAVRIRAMSDITIEMEIRRWMRRYFPNWNYGPYERMELGDRQYAIVTASNPGSGGSATRRIYFDVTKKQGDDDDASGPGF